MLDAEREAASLVRRNPGLLVGGGLAAVAVVVAYVVGGLVTDGIDAPAWAWLLFAVGAGSVGRVLLLPFPLAGLYVAARRACDDGDSRATAGTVLGGAVREYRRLLGATVAARLVALALAVPLFGLLLAGDTLLTYVQYASGGDPLALLTGNRLAVLVVVPLAGALARLPVAFYDLPVLFGGVAGSRGWRAALRFARRRPRALLRYGAGRALLWSPVVVVPVAGTVGVTRATGGPLVGTFWGTTVVLAATVAAAVVVPTLVAAHHVVVYERAVEPVLREPTPTGGEAGAASPATASLGDERSVRSDGGDGRRRIAVAALAVLVVTAGVAGAAVRIADVRPTPTEAHPVEPSMDADAIVENAESTVERTSHRYRQRIYEVDSTTGERTPTMTWRFALDRQDRRAQLLLVEGANGSAEGADLGYVYGSESTLASNPLGADRWVVDPSLGYVDVAGDASLPWSRSLPDGVDWRVVERTDDRVVVGFERPPGADEVLTEWHGRLHVDPDTGRPIRTVERRTFTTDADDGTERERIVTVTEFSGYGEADVERPEGADGRGPLEWLSDLVFY